MFTYIQITRLNDFLFCPYSIYLHNIYENYESQIYHSKFQKRGKLVHKTVDEKDYSTSKNILQGMSVFSNKYNLIGKIDLFYKNTGLLVERKYKVQKIYDGYKLQLYAQMVCLEERGLKVKRIQIRSLSDNKVFDIRLPNKQDLDFLQDVIQKLRYFKPENFEGNVSKNKCKMCIYNTLCPFYKK